MPDEVVLDVLAFLFGEDSLLNPTYRLPAFELHRYLLGRYGLDEVEKDVALDGVTCEIEWLVDLDEC